MYKLSNNAHLEKFGGCDSQGCLVKNKQQVMSKLED